MNTSELAATLDLLAQALRLLPAQPGQAPGVAAPALAVASQKTLAEWLDVHEQQLRERGYKAQTLKNRGANLKHVRRLWGARPINAIKPHEIATALKQYKYPEMTSLYTDDRGLSAKDWKRVELAPAAG